MEKALDEAKNLGFQAVFLVRAPAYYHRFGFQQTTRFGIKNTSNFPNQYVLGLELVPDTRKDIKGITNLA